MNVSREGEGKCGKTSCRIHYYCALPFGGDFLWVWGRPVMSMLITSYQSKDFLQNQETFNEGDVIPYCCRHIFLFHRRLQLDSIQQSLYTHRTQNKPRLLAFVLHCMLVLGFKHQRAYHRPASGCIGGSLVIRFVGAQPVDSRVWGFGAKWSSIFGSGNDPWNVVAALYGSQQTDLPGYGKTFSTAVQIHEQ